MFLREGVGEGGLILERARMVKKIEKPCSDELKDDATGGRVAAWRHLMVQ